MVYTGMFAGRESSAYLETRMDPEWAKPVQITAIGQQVEAHAVYRTDFWFFFAAALVEVVCIALIMPK